MEEKEQVLCHSCGTETAVDSLQFIDNGNVVERMYCIHCIQPMYELGARNAKKVPHEEVKTEQNI